MVHHKHSIYAGYALMGKYSDDLEVDKGALVSGSWVNSV